MNMREKIARAIYEAWAKAKGTDATWDEAAAGANDGLTYPILKETYELAFAEADSVLSALMEPTAEMELAGGFKYEAMWFEDDGTMTGVIFTDMGTIFRTMIEAARNGA